MISDVQCTCTIKCYLHVEIQDMINMTKLKSDHPESGIPVGHILQLLSAKLWYILVETRLFSSIPIQVTSMS